MNQRNKVDRSLRTTMGVLVGAAVITTAVGVGLISLLNANGALARANDSALEAVAQAKEALVVEIVRMRSEQVGRIADLAPVRALATEATPEVVAAARDALGEWVAGDEIEGITVLDPNGLVVVSTTNAVARDDWSSQSFFAHARGLPAFHGFVDGANDSATFRLTHPVTGATGMRFVLVADVDAAALYSALLDRTGLGESGEAYLLDRRGTMLSPSRFESNAEFRTVNRAGAFRQWRTGIPGGGSWSSYHGDEPVRGFVMFDDLARAGLTDVAVVCEVDETEALAAVTELRRDVFYGALAFASVAFAIAFAFARSLTTPIERLLGSALAIGSGDLTHAPAIETRRDEIGALSAAFGDMHRGLRQLLSTIRNGADALSGSTTDVARSTRRYAEVARIQAASLASTNSALAEARVGSASTAEGANDVLAATEAAAESARHGIDAVESGVTAIGEIEERVSAIANEILELSQRSAQIGQIVASVNDLAEQANLLAVNASVEAAKAGDRGRGFSVVATEVRSLAEHSKRAVTQIRRILTEIQRATEGVVMAAEEGGKRTEDGRRAIEKIRGTITELSSTLDENSASARRIAAAASDQALGIARVSEALESIHRASEDAAKEVVSIEISVDVLASMGGQLGVVAGKYRL